MTDGLNPGTFTTALTTACAIACVCGPGPGCSPTRDHSEKADRHVENTAQPPVEVRVDDPSMIQYTVRFPGRHNHYADIEGVFPVAKNNPDVLELKMAVWTPGSYLIREYSRHVEDVRAASEGGVPLGVTKVSKNRWAIKTQGARRVTVRYRVYCSGLSVRTNYVTHEIAILNGAPTFMTPAADETRPFDIALEPPSEWHTSVTQLSPHPSGDAHRYVAPDYDTLVDSPIVLGNPALYEFDVEGVPHILANFGEGGVFDGERSARDMEAIVRAEIAFWGEIPYRRYTVLNVLWEQGGGLEHEESTLIMGSRFQTRKRESYRQWLELVSHEFFHTWNVKRLRPEALTELDYESEAYTRTLWIAEGITAYYEVLTLRRAGLIDDATYLARLSEEVETLQTRPGRLTQSLADSSFDAWIKFYRPDENSRNTSISYYNKGALAGLLLDVEIRRATQNRNSLDDVMRLAYQRFSGDTGFAPSEFRRLADEVAGRPLDEFFAHAIESTRELDYTPFLEFYGLRFAPEPPRGENDEEPAGYLGADVSPKGVISNVIRGTPAYGAGLEVGDELLAIDNYRVQPAGLDERLELYRPGDQIDILVAHRDKLRHTAVTLGDQPRTSWKLEPDPDADQLTRSRRAHWLEGDRPVVLKPDN